MSEWEAAQQDLIDSGLDSLASMITDDLAKAVLTKEEDHPARRVLLSPRCQPLPAFASATDNALQFISRWLLTADGQAERGWFDSKLRKLSASGPEASGTLAELRAFGTMLSTAETPTEGLSVAPHHGKGTAPDFRIGRSSIAYVEVCCVRMNDDESERQEQLDGVESELHERAREAAEARQLAEAAGQRSSSRATAEWSTTRPDSSSQVRRHSAEAVAFTRTDGSVGSFAIATRQVAPVGPLKKEGAVHTIASRIASRKAAGQIPSGCAGILWMDVTDPSWCMSVKHTQPVEVFWKGMALANTPGVWHAFYGRKGITPTFERAAVGLELGEGRQAEPQVFDGRFRHPAGRAWSAAVLRCANGLVIFEHPEPLVPLPFALLRELVALEGYRPEASFHRFSDYDFDGLQRRLDDVERQLRFLAS